jgi:hypothetical protein
MMYRFHTILFFAHLCFAVSDLELERERAFAAAAAAQAEAGEVLPARPVLSIKPVATKPTHTNDLPPGVHAHRCSFDGTIWTHTEASYGKAQDHACPNCGRLQWNKYVGPMNMPTKAPSRSCPT